MAPRKKSIVWSFFVQTSDKQFAVCKLCNQKLKYFSSTSNLKQHIIRKHQIQYQQEMNRENPSPSIQNETDPDTDSEIANNPAQPAKLQRGKKTSSAAVLASQDEIIIVSKFICK